MLKKLSILFCALLLNGCSVFMAAREQGTSVEDITQCKTRVCLLNKGAVTVSQKTNKQDVLTEELMQVQMPTGSSARAVMHGALDVATLGLWEVAGTPMEGVLNKQDKYAIKVRYEADGETIKSVQLVR